MKIGTCGSIDSAAATKAAGFDFIEVNVQGVLKGELDDAAWSAQAPDFDKVVLPIEAANSLVPGSLPIVGSQRDLATLTQYMQRVAQRAAKVGIKRLVFGSGGARKRPDDIDTATAWKHIEEFAQIAADACDPYDDLHIVIEHLNKKETNTLNSLADSQRLAERVNHPRLSVLIDTYHYALENEQDQAVLDLGQRVKHVHVAEPVQRTHPGAHGPHGQNADAYDFVHFFCLLHKIGYDERLSFEGKWSKPLPEAGSGVVTLLRDAWNKAADCAP